MNRKLILYFSALLLIFFSSFATNTNSNIISEPEKSEQHLTKSLDQDNQIDTNSVTSDIVETNAKPNAHSSECHSCSKEKILTTLKEEEMEEKEEKQYNERLEYIKQQILSKLGMSEAPKLELTHEDTNNYLQLLEASSLALFSAHIPEVMTKSKPLDSDKVFIFPIVKRFNISQFNISIAKDSFGVNSIQKITLFVKQQTLHLDNNSIDKELVVISTAVPVNGVLTRFQDISNMRVLGIVEPQEVNEKLNSIDRQSLPNWIQYDLTQILKPEVINANKLVSFDSESLDMKDSFITVEQNNHSNMRIRRSIDCNGNSTSCCRESFYVNFTTIGWDNWILQPIGYNANYCKGKCDISNARYHHTTVIGKYSSISLCCSPREMSHISLIYLDDKGVVFQKNLANMVVESCDCA